MTASHCTVFFENDLAPLGYTAFVSFDNLIPFGDLSSNQTKLIPVTQVVTNPNFSQAQSDTGDIAVLLVRACDNKCGAICLIAPLRPHCSAITAFSEWVCSASTRSVWSAASPRRFSFHRTQSGEGSPHSKRSAPLSTQLDTDVNKSRHSVSGVWLHFIFKDHQSRARISCRCGD